MVHDEKKIILREANMTTSNMSSKKPPNFRSGVFFPLQNHGEIRLYFYTQIDNEEARPMMIEGRVSGVQEQSFNVSWSESLV
jgi:hypothetical protein